MYATATVLAGVMDIAHPLSEKIGSQFEQIRYVNPEAMIGA